MLKEPAEVSNSGAKPPLITTHTGGNGSMNGFMSFMFIMLIYPLRERTKTCCFFLGVLVSINILIEFKPMAVKKTRSWSFTHADPYGNLLQSTFYPQLASSVKINK